jgi:hypothetical protein
MTMLCTRLAATCAALFALAVASPALARPTAIVALGDSEISGEGAGNYQSGTNGPSNYCHRSLNAWIMVTAIPADVHVNLACSGANSSNLRLGGSGQYGEASQADQANALFHSTADFSWFKIFKPGQPDHLKFSFHNLFDFIRGLVSVLKKGQRNIFADGKRGEQRAGLE